MTGDETTLPDTTRTALRQLGPVETTRPDTTRTTSRQLGPVLRQLDPMLKQVGWDIISRKLYIPRPMIELAAEYVQHNRRKYGFLEYLANRIIVCS